MVVRRQHPRPRPHHNHSLHWRVTRILFSLLRCMWAVSAAAGAAMSHLFPSTVDTGNSPTTLYLLFISFRWYSFNFIFFALFLFVVSYCIVLSCIAMCCIVVCYVAWYGMICHVPSRYIISYSHFLKIFGCREHFHLFKEWRHCVRVCADQWIFFRGPRSVHSFCLWYE